MLIFCILAVYFEKFYCEDDIEFVTYGSTVKIQNVGTKYRLHSHDVRYQKGSLQQSITGFHKGDDANSLWFIKAEHGKMEQRGIPVLCGAVLRFEHVTTMKNLHSHLVKAHFSPNEQEVSGFGNAGNGDHGDNWQLICIPDQHVNNTWTRDRPFKLQHRDTKKFLFAHKEHTHSAPIQDQLEITTRDDNSNEEGMWKTAEGFYIHPRP